MIDIPGITNITDAQLIELAHTTNARLCNGGRWTMSVPPERTDPDLIFGELERRFKIYAGQGAP